MKLRTAAFVIALFALHTADVVAQAQGPAFQSLAELWDTSAVNRVLRTIKHSPASPQPIVLAFAEDGTLERFVTTDTVAADLRQLLRDSVPPHVVSGTRFANQHVRIYLVNASPSRLVPRCDDLPPQFRPANFPAVNEAFNRELGRLRGRGDRSRTQSGTGTAGMLQTRATTPETYGTLLVSLIVGTDGHPYAVQVAESTAPTPVQQAAVEAARRWRFTAVPGTAWVQECMAVQRMRVWW